MAKTYLEVAADIIDPPDDHWKPLPHQIAPLGHWFVWLLMGGRGAGKTATAARHMHEHVHGPPCLPDVPGGHWPSIIGPTLGDAVTSCVLGPSGLRAHDPGVKVRQTAGGTTVRWSNGVEAKLFGAHTPEDVERLRSGGNRCIVWAEEVAAWRYLEECWQHMRYGLRLGPWPHVVASTTPKARKLIKELVTKAVTAVMGGNGWPEIVMTRATTEDNPHLNSEVKRMLFADYGGTRLGRQELYAEILEDIEGALWNQLMIDQYRIKWEDQPKTYSRTVVAVDPSAGGPDECGIVVLAKKDKWEERGILRPDLPHGFVLADRSLHGSPNKWARTAIRAYKDFHANYIVAEVNNGGDMVKNTIQSIDPSIWVKVVHATRGKAKRAEPVANIYEQGRVHHVGEFPKLEEEQTTWDAYDPEDSWSPNRMDALVWGGHDLLVGLQRSTKGKYTDRRLAGRR